MSLVPSHDGFLLKATAGSARLPIGSHWFDKLFQSADGISQNDPVPILVHLLKHRLPIFNCYAIHLLARCDRPGDPSACTTGRYL